MIHWVINKFDGLEGVKKARLLSAVAVAAILAATLWPFNPFPRNHVHWLEGTNGIRLGREAIVLSEGPLKKPVGDDASGYTIELVLRPIRIRSSGTILSFYNATQARQPLQLRQWRDGLVVTHDPQVQSDKTRSIKFDVSHLFHLEKPVFVALSAGPDGTRVYVDGRFAQFVPTFKIRGDDVSGEVILGTAPEGYDQWLGEVRGFGIYGKKITAEEASQHFHAWSELRSGPSVLVDGLARYTFAEGAGSRIQNEVTSEPDLRIPERFGLPHKPFLETPLQESRTNRSYVHDVLTNIAGFVPLGMAICCYLVWTRARWKAILTATLFCGMLSFAIEVGQFYIPSRGSGITDVITNTVGAGLGALLLESNLVCRLLRRIGIVPNAGQPSTPHSRVPASVTNA